MDLRTYGPTDGRTDTTSYRDAKSHLKISFINSASGLDSINQRNIKLLLKLLYLCKHPYPLLTTGITLFYLCQYPHPLLLSPSKKTPHFLRYQNPCREEEGKANVCQSKSEDNVCVHTGPNELECVCNKFWEGEICQKDVNECSKCDVGDGTGCPCKNGGTCRNVEQSNDNPFGFQCL